jgi:hypothetical protein
MNDAAWVVALWGAAVLLLGWTWIPALLSGLGGTRYANGGTEDPSALQTASEPDYLYFERQLAARGYEPLGAGWMRITLYGRDWRYETQVRAFWSAGRKTFAFLQKQPRPLDVWWLTMFATCWADGGMLLTSNGADQPPDASDYVVQGMESMDLAAVEELHHGEAARLRATGRRPDPDGSLDTLLRATARHAGPAARYTGVKLGQSYLLAHAAIHAVLTLPVAMTVGLGHWGVPMVNLVLGGILLASEYMARQRAGRLMREQVAAQMSATDKPGA